MFHRLNDCEKYYEAPISEAIPENHQLRKRVVVVDGEEYNYCPNCGAYEEIK